jgi:hypothetical protein
VCVCIDVDYKKFASHRKDGNGGYHDNYTEDLGMHKSSLDHKACPSDLSRQTTDFKLVQVSLSTHFFLSPWAELQYEPRRATGQGQLMGCPVLPQHSPAPWRP